MPNVKEGARRLAITAAIIAAASLTTIRPAEALDAGTAVGIGLGSFALGSALGSTARPHPYYAPYDYYYRRLPTTQRLVIIHRRVAAGTRITGVITPAGGRSIWPPISA